MNNLFFLQQTFDNGLHKLIPTGWRQHLNMKDFRSLSLSFYLAQSVFLTKGRINQGTFRHHHCHCYEIKVEKLEGGLESINDEGGGLEGINDGILKRMCLALI